MWYKFLFLIGIQLGLLACQGDIKIPEQEESPLKIKQINYYVRYLEEIQEIQMEAQFRTDSANFVLEGDVWVNGTKMRAKKLPAVGWQYKVSEKPSKFEGLYIFSFPLSTEKMQKDSLAFKVLGDLKMATPQIKKETGGLIQWTGEALTQEDALTLIFEDSNQETFSVNHVGISRGSQLEIRPELIEGLALGTASVRIVQKRREQIQQSGINILKNMEYYYKPIKVEILP